MPRPEVGRHGQGALSWAARRGGGACPGVPWLRRHAFAAGFLLFTIPLPEPVIDVIEITLQYASASVVEVFFRMGSEPFLRERRSFWFSGLRIEVAQQCRGVRSTLVLRVTAILGTFVLLSRPDHRLILL